MFRQRKPVRPLIALTVLTAALAVSGVLSGERPAPVRAADEPLHVLAPPPATWDPAHVGDAYSAAVVMQVFESLTTLDPGDNIQPALAESWTVSADGRRVDFKLRPNLHYSDATPITAQHVVDSWLRLIDPQDPGVLASLLSDVTGATEYMSGQGARDGVGVRAEGDHVIVDLRRPAAYFVAVTSSPSLSVVPPSLYDRIDAEQLPANMVVSGGYLPTAQSESAITYQSNLNYWAGPPQIDWIEQVLPGDGVNAVEAFEAGDLDYAPISAYEADWIKFDRDLGPQLRQTPDLSTHYYGFDATRAPFDDDKVRRAFGEAVDWGRIVSLAGGTPAMSMVPPGLIGAGNEDYKPAYNPDDARALLAAAGYPGGAGFPQIALQSIGWGYEVAVAAELERELGITVSVEIVDFGDIAQRDATGNVRQLWTETWSADYPDAHDFLGLLLETGSGSNYGGWSNAQFDAAIAAAAATTDPAVREQQYHAAQLILREQVPVVPVESYRGYALSRNGLLGALQTGAGFIRFAGLAWAADSGR